MSFEPAKLAQHLENVLDARMSVRDALKSILGRSCERLRNS